MSQEQPKQPKAENQTPPTPAPQTAASGQSSPMQQAPTPPGTKTSASKVQPKPEVQSFWVRLRVFVTTFLVWWNAALAKVRTRLPESVNRKLPNDTVLSGAIAGLFILLFAAISILSPGKAPEAATVQPDTLPAREIAVSPEVTASPEANLPPAIEAPAELTAPSAPEAVETIAVPPPVLTPEQSLIAAIQQQVAQLTGEYADGSIESIQANFQDNFLSVKVSDNWYTFAPAKQDSIAADIWRRAQQLEFNKLEMFDNRGSLVARSPVVGSNMVILLREYFSS